MQPWMLLKRTGHYGLVIFRTKPLGFVPCVVEIERDLFHTRRQCSGCFFCFFLIVQNYTRYFSVRSLVPYTLQCRPLSLRVLVQSPRQLALSLNTKQRPPTELARAVSVSLRCLWSTIRWWDVRSHGLTSRSATVSRLLADGHLGKWWKGVNNSSAAAWLLWLQSMQCVCVLMFLHTEWVFVWSCVDLKRTVGLYGIESSTTIEAHSSQGRMFVCLSRDFKTGFWVNEAS